jgi:16S rRNA pseudouridine516 synthase
MQKRIDQWLSQLGYCSRQEARSFLKKHEVFFKQNRLKDPSEKVSSEITIDGSALDHPFGLVLLMHKPPGYVCSQAENEGPRVFDLLPARWQKRQLALQTVGRLDKDTTGTLLLTDQGHWLHQWSHPKVHFKKTYFVHYEGVLSEEAEELWQNGQWILPGEKEPCLKASLTRLDKGVARLILQEGRYHQVKRMFAALGAKVIKLHRENFGPWSADHLQEGQWEILDLQAIENIVLKYKDFLKEELKF